MIRWGYALPRLMILAGIGLFLWFGLSPLLRWTLITSGQKITSAKVDIGELNASLLGTKLSMVDVQVADPRSPSKNLVEADEIRLEFDTNGLLRKKFVVNRGEIRGLRLGADRETSGELAPSGGLQIDLPIDQMAQAGAEWLEQIGGSFAQDLLDQYESVRLVEEMVDRWPDEYEQLRARVLAFKSNIEEIRAVLETKNVNVLRNVDTYQNTAAKIEGIQRDLVEIRAEIKRLPDQALRDRDAITTATGRDLQRIEEQLQMLRDIDGESLSGYLLGPELAERVATFVNWVRWCRQMIPRRIDDREPDRARGIDVLFAGIHQRPDFLIRSLALEGQGTIGHEQFTFLGTATDITSQPKLHGRPTVLRIEAQGRTAATIEAVFDRSGEIPTDRIVFDCPALPQPERTLGRPDQLALAISPGTTQLWASFELKGEDLSGQIRIEQGPIELEPRVPAEYGGARLAESLRAAVRDVKTIQVAVDLTGTVEHPTWKIQTDLGQQLADGFNRMLERELTARREELAGRLRQQIDERLRQFEQLVLAKQQSVFGELEQGSGQIRDLNQLIARRISLPEGFLGRQLPREMPLRF